jgi:hypothetical protein
MCDHELIHDPEWEDPIVKEIHDIRERMAEECGYDMATLVAYITWQAKEVREQVPGFPEQSADAGSASNPPRRADAA